MKRVLQIFREISAVPRSSGNREGIADYCMDFAARRGIEAQRDGSGNVILRKSATPGYENAPGIILQGHLDMVCQKDEGVETNFETDGICVLEQDGFLYAQGTTLGADNGIAVAMALAILEREDLEHPRLEAVLTSDEEIGLVGATLLDKSLLRGTRMINLDAEEENRITTSCAGGGCFSLRIPAERESRLGREITLSLHGLSGGHSGVEIHRGRANAISLMGRLLYRLSSRAPFFLLSLSGGEKDNAIPTAASATLLCADGERLSREAKAILEEIADEVHLRESGFSYSVGMGGQKRARVFSEGTTRHLASALFAAPTGVVAMSAQIPDLVETSLNLGVVRSEEQGLFIRFSLRSNSAAGFDALKSRISAFSVLCGGEGAFEGECPPWEFTPVSPLRERYAALYESLYGKRPTLSALHAGLECGVFCGAMPGLDCISVGPNLYDVHTTKERLDIASAERVYRVLCRLLREA
ncbi:MAG: aminoacyl-histidine dipeptidase [Clostridia bacterium]|nr:aminoacyl-histidine dipeptidase [Clostridia bacterium]